MKRFAQMPRQRRDAGSSTYKAQRLATARMIGETERSLTAAAANRPLAVLRHLLRLAHDEWGVLERVPKIRTEKEFSGPAPMRSATELVR